MAKNGLGFWRGGDAEKLGADGDAAVTAHFDFGLLTPDKGPPRAFGNQTQRGAFFFEGESPGLLGRHFKFAVNFVLVAMEAQLVDLGIGLVEVGELFAGEVGREAILPKEVSALDFALGLRGGRVTEGDTVEVKGAAQLGERPWGLGKEDGMEIDVDLQRQAMFDEGRREQVEIGEQIFGFINFGGGKDPAAIVEHVDHGEGLEAAWKPGMRRGIQLPELSKLAGLPAADCGGGTAVEFGMGEAMGDGPAADLSSIHLEAALPEHFAARKAVRGWGLAAEHSM
jgi:hypothetical protein